jgi:CBS domain-containing protein
MRYLKMKVEDIMIKDLRYVSSGDYISKALGMMKSNRIHQLLVIDDNKLSGILELRKIVTKDMDPKITKVRTLMSNSPVLKKHENIEKCAELLLSSGFRAIPVVDKGKVVGIISETDIITFADDFIDTNKDASEISSKCIYAEKTDNMGKIRKLMLEKNISRIPIVDKERVIGVVETLDLIKLLEGTERMDARGGKLKEAGSKEKIGINAMPAESLMSQPVVVSGGKNIKDIVNLLQKYEEVIIQNGNTCIVTPKDILEMIVSKPKKGVYVQITGMQQESAEFQARTDKTVEEFVQKMGRMIKNIDYLFIHVERMTKGGKVKYSIRIRFMTPVGMFISHAWGWHPIDVMQASFNKLQKEIMKKHGKMEKRKGK